MLQQVLEHIHNYFIKRPNPGTYTIADGMISPLPELKEGQRFWIVGSDMNEGVYTFHADGILNDDGNAEAMLTDEFFAGSICALAVPPAVIQLATEISQWMEENAENVYSPYQSESFNGYSYSLKTGGSGQGDGQSAMGWESIFRARLNRWRRPCL